MKTMITNLEIEKIRNFCVIAHIDHGKSTLADRFLEYSSGVKLSSDVERVMDTLDIEQERGITIKMQSARMMWDNHILNLIDTPGHVDFSFEVSRSVVASEGALLLVDAMQGIQAQTISNARLAQDHGLEVIPVISKIDMPNIDINKRRDEICAVLGFKPSDIFMVSGKTGQGVKDLLDAIVLIIPSPIKRLSDSLQALIYDSIYDEYRGVILMVRLFGGKIKKGQRVFVGSDNRSFIVNNVGYFTPSMVERDMLNAGEVGYVETGVKDFSFIRVGETLVDSADVKPLHLYTRPRPRIFASIFPIENKNYPQLLKSIEKLSLNDVSFTIAPQRSEILGTGFRIGFLGLLHMEVFQERLEREFEAELIITSPSVGYKATLKNGENISIETPSEYPDPQLVESFQEPIVTLRVVTPLKYMSVVMDLCQNRRGEYLGTEESEQRYNIDFLTIIYKMPLSEIISNFFDTLKSVSRGYASMDYSEDGFREADIVKVSVLVNKKEVEALSFLDVKSNARKRATRLLSVLKEAIPRHQFEIPLQATIGARVIARENIKAFRKDVLVKLHASDPSRRAKLLNKQKEGKARMKEVGKVSIPQSAFLSILKT
ncbi:MAG TPA: translation elongation factor 4 [Candidatus Dojkabacteria bacterium]|nr:translation elongation factor 4 [Candidatus Dojkabacteria bacterium]